jgi:hypothetical protein
MREGNGRVTYIMSTVIPGRILICTTVHTLSSCRQEASRASFLAGIQIRLSLNKWRATNQTTDLFALVWPKTFAPAVECACPHAASSATDAALESQDHSEPGKFQNASALSLYTSTCQLINSAWKHLYASLGCPTGLFVFIFCIAGD